MTDWDQRFLDLADHVSMWSKDPSTKVGAVIVRGKNEFISLGYNGFPQGIEDDPLMYADRTTKLLYMAHAERNALDLAPGPVHGCTIYSPLLPCVECAKSIAQKGITRVVSYTPNREDVFNWETTKMIFKKKGIVLTLREREYVQS